MAWTSYTRINNILFCGFQNGNDCYCGDNPVRRYEDALDCNKKCPGNSDFTCGGATSNDVYHVSTGKQESMMFPHYRR